MEPQLDPNEIPNPEQEALLKVGMDSQESLEDINANTGASAVKLGEIEQNTEASIVQQQKSTKELKEAINTGGQMDQLVGAFMMGVQTMLRGDKGDKGDKGERGERGPVGPRGKTGPQGERGLTGLRGQDGRNPLSVSKQAPSNPQVGDLWYQP